MFIVFNKAKDDMLKRKKIVEGLNTIIYKVESIEKITYLLEYITIIIKAFTQLIRFINFKFFNFFLGILFTLQ